MAIEFILEWMLAGKAKKLEISTKSDRIVVQKIDAPRGD
jgi:hypothetical protein